MNKLSAALTLCFSLAAHGAAMADNTYKLSDEDMEIIKKSQALIKGETEPSEVLGFDINLSDFADKQKIQAEQKDVRNLVDQVMAKHSEMPVLGAGMQPLQGDQEAPAPKPYADHSTLIFASLSLGDAGLKDLLSFASGIEEAVVVFRGIPRDESMTVALTRLQQLASEHDPMPALIINPDLFRSYGVTAVPTIVNVDQNELPIGGDVAQPIAKVQGISDPQWLNKAVEEGNLGDLGVKGPTVAPSEVDLIELAKERVAQIDWEEKQKAAVKNYWNNQNFLRLPRAPKTQVRSFDPSIQITQDIQAPDGTYIARQGDIINPLKIRAFTQALIVFDATDKKQVEKVLEVVPELEADPNIRFISYIATEVDPIRGWDAFEEITDTLDAHVTFLTPDVASRFELAHVPSVITSGGDVFHITELSVND